MLHRVRRNVHIVTEKTAGRKRSALVLVVVVFSANGCPTSWTTGPQWGTHKRRTTLPRQRTIRTHWHNRPADTTADDGGDDATGSPLSSLPVTAGPTSIRRDNVTIFGRYLRRNVTVRVYVHDDDWRTNTVTRPPSSPKRIHTRHTFTCATLRSKCFVSSLYFHWNRRLLLFPRLFPSNRVFTIIYRIRLASISFFFIIVLFILYVSSSTKYVLSFF